MSDNLPEPVKVAPDWDDLVTWVADEKRDHLELRDLCRRFGLPATGPTFHLRRTLRDCISTRRQSSALVPEYAIPASWHPFLVVSKQAARTTPRAACDWQVWVLVGPAYALPALGLGAAAFGVGVLGATWPLLLLAAVGLQAVVSVSVLRRQARDEVPGAEDNGRYDGIAAQKDLFYEFAQIKSAEGLKALQELTCEYRLLHPFLARRRPTDSLAIGQLPLLASDAYLQGISVLQDALDLMHASGREDTGCLQAENRDIERQIADLGPDPAQTVRVGIRRERLVANRELLDLTAKQQERVDWLLYQCERCASSLHRLRMELAALRADGSEDRVDVVVDTLRLTISHAKSVQDEMKRLTLPAI